MAVNTLLLNQDRCTKNYDMYWDKTGTGEWQMLPWDLEESLGISSGLNGKPAVDYCILECQQWNSPLYCDWNHTQVMHLPMIPYTAFSTYRHVDVMHDSFSCPPGVVCTGAQQYVLL